MPPDPELKLSGDIVKKPVEANRDLASLELISAQIEGIQCTLDDVLDPEVDGNTNLDVGDVINYANAAAYAIGRSETLPLCNRLLRELHQKLLSGAEGRIRIRVNSAGHRTGFSRDPHRKGVRRVRLTPLFFNYTLHSAPAGRKITCFEKPFSSTMVKQTSTSGSRL